MISPLQQLNVGLVSQCVLDYMQLVCLGKAQKLIFFWLDGQLSTRLSSITVHAISLRMLSFVIHMPRVARKLRSLQETKCGKPLSCNNFCFTQDQSYYINR